MFRISTQPIDLRGNQAPALIEEAKGIAGFDLGDRPEYGAVGNAHGVRTDRFVYSRRLDSRTLFARDTGYGPSARLGAWTGAKRPLERACRALARGAGVPRSEIAHIDVVTELGVTAEFVDGEEPRTTRPVPLTRVAIARRTVDGIEVWQSYCSVELTADGAIGKAEVHWPEIPALVLREADVLRTEVVPALDGIEIGGARPESMTAGIVHSGAIGFLMELRAAIRVVVAPTTGEHIGRKMVAYLDRTGAPIDLPRDLVVDCHHPGERVVPR